MSTQKRKTLEALFQEEMIGTYDKLQDVLREVREQRQSFVSTKYPEVKRNIDLAYQHLEDASMRIIKIDNIVGGYVG